MTSHGIHIQDLIVCSSCVFAPCLCLASLRIYVTNISFTACFSLRILHDLDKRQGTAIELAVVIKENNHFPSSVSIAWRGSLFLSPSRWVVPLLRFSSARTSASNDTPNFLYACREVSCDLFAWCYLWNEFWVLLVSHKHRGITVQFVSLWHLHCIDLLRNKIKNFLYIYYTVFF